MQLTPLLLFSIIIGYFLILLAIGWYTGRDSSNSTFFLGKRESPWYIVAYGMIGGSLSGVSLISIPGKVGVSQFDYMQIVYGYLLGYMVIAFVLMPLYYRLSLASIYGYLMERFGRTSYKTGSGFFIVSRTLGASLRLYIGSAVIYDYVFVHWGVPYWVTVVGSLALIWLYTYRGGIKTIVWTDTFQTTCLLFAVIFSIVSISSELGLSFTDIPGAISNSGMGKMFFFENAWTAPNTFWKHFIGGAFIAIAMTGLDQDMMQKNLTCKTLKEGQLNVLSFSAVLIFVNLMILSLGALLYLYAEQKGIALPLNAAGKPITDKVFPIIAFEHLSPYIGLIFAVGLISTAYASADSAITALTTSFCVDFLGFSEKEGDTTGQERNKRNMVHLGFSLIVLTTILIFFYFFKGAAVIDILFKIANFTYGPLLGLFTFGLFTKLPIRDHLTPLICVLAPTCCWFLDANSVQWFSGYKFGNELLILNGLLTFLGLLAISKRKLT